ncbi:MAG: hypothetical protein ACE5FL_05870 [Myxococcota bacterium]
MQSRSASILVAAMLCLIGSAATSVAQTSWTTDIAAGTTEIWCNATNPGPIILEKPIFVQGKLTITPGCIVRGQPRTSTFDPLNPTVGAPGVLVVSQGGFIDAQGTSTNPIIMTTAAPDVTDCSLGAPATAGSDGVADDADCNPTNGRDAWVTGNAFLDGDPVNNPLAPLALDGSQNVQLWGGFVILGKAPTNLEDDFGLGFGVAPVEGLAVPGFPAAAAQYGGTQPHDCSGVIRFISVRHAGDVIGANNELNGVTMGAVGDCTIFENIEVYTNQDDGIEYFGGTLNSKNLVLSYVGDDSLDLDQGFDGSIQNVLSISTFFNQDSGVAYGNGGSGDAAGEWDGDDADLNVNVGGSFDDADIVDRAYPLGAPAVYNMTALGNVVNGVANPAVSPNAANRGIRMRNDFEGILANSIVVNTGTQACFTYDEKAGPGGASGQNPIQATVYAVSCSDTAAPDAGGLAAAGRGEADITAGAVSGGATPSNYGPGLAGGATVSPLLTNEDSYFEPKCAAATVAGRLVGCKATPIDPRPAVAAPVVEIGNGIVPSGIGLDASATYRGAFPSGQPLFTDGWTALNTGGVL